MTLQKKLLNWFSIHRRELPWREQRSPYSVWVSEIMLQQTRVDTVIPYFKRWMDRFPTLESLAAADAQEVLRLWEGLGYYSRARSLHRAAKQIMENEGGEIPSDPGTLKKIPGIGAYTAGAIASIGFDRRAAALDGNIRRIYTRLADMDLPLGSKAAESKLQQLAEHFLPDTAVGDYHEALMDLGSMICTPQNPDCEHCPIQADCLAYRNQTVTERPVIAKREAVPHLQVTAAIILDPPDSVLITQRPAKGLLGGLWEFPGGKCEEGESLEQCLKREIREELDSDIQIRSLFGVYKHAYTHFKVTLHAFLCETSDTPVLKAAQQLRWTRREELAEYPMGKIDRQISRKLAETPRQMLFAATEEGNK